MTEVQQLQLQIANQKAQIKDFKRFKSRYQSIVQQNDMVDRLLDTLLRERAKLKRCVENIAAIQVAEHVTPEYLVDYASKVLKGLGY